MALSARRTDMVFKFVFCLHSIIIAKVSGKDFWNYTSFLLICSYEAELEVWMRIGRIQSERYLASESSE